MLLIEFLGASLEKRKSNTAQAKLLSGVNAAKGGRDNGDGEAIIAGVIPPFVFSLKAYFVGDKMAKKKVVKKKIKAPKAPAKKKEVSSQSEEGNGRVESRNSSNR